MKENLKWWIPNSYTEFLKQMSVSDPCRLSLDGFSSSSSSSSAAAAVDGCGVPIDGQTVSQSTSSVGSIMCRPRRRRPHHPFVRRGGGPGVCVTSSAVIRGRQRRRPRRPGSWLGRIWHAHPYKSLISRWLNCGATSTMRRCSQLIYAGACGETTNSGVQT